MSDGDDVEIQGPKRLYFEDPKPYLTIEEASKGELRFSFLLPPYELEELQNGYKQKLTINFSERQLT